MPGNVTLRSFLDMRNGVLEDTVDTTSNGQQMHSALRRFTKEVSALPMTPGDDAEKDGLYYEYAPGGLVTALGSDAYIEDTIGRELCKPVRERTYRIDAYKSRAWAKNVLDYGEDIIFPGYISFYNLSQVEVDICKRCNPHTVGENTVYSLVPFIRIPANASVGPIAVSSFRGNLYMAFPQTDGGPVTANIYCIVYDK